jgi:hypothetical protein
MMPYVTNSLTGPLMALGGLIGASGGAFITIAELEPSKTPHPIWVNVWFDLGFGCVILGLVVGVIGLYLHFWRRTDQPSSDSLAPDSVTLLGGIVGGNSRLDIDSSADSFATDTIFTGNSTVTGRHRPSRPGDSDG